MYNVHPALLQVELKGEGPEHGTEGVRVDHRAAHPRTAGTLKLCQLNIGQTSSKPDRNPIQNFLSMIPSLLARRLMQSSLSPILKMARMRKMPRMMRMTAMHKILLVTNGSA